jgi:serine protease Do
MDEDDWLIAREIAMSKKCILFSVLITGCSLLGSLGYGATEKLADGYLGVFMQPVPEILAVHLGLGEAVGVVAADVAAESPAEKAGIVQYDVIVAVNGKEVKDQEAFAKAVRQAGAGTKVKLSLIDKGQRKDVEVTLGELPAERAEGKRDQSKGIGRRLFREGERPDDLMGPGARMPRFMPPAAGPDARPLVVPDVDQERIQAIEDRIEKIEKQQAEILEKLSRLLEK